MMLENSGYSELNDIDWSYVILVKNRILKGLNCHRFWYLTKFAVHRLLSRSKN